MCMRHRLLYSCVLAAGLVAGTATAHNAESMSFTPACNDFFSAAYDQLRNRLHKVRIAKRNVNDAESAEAFYDALTAAQAYDTTQVIDDTTSNTLTDEGARHACLEHRMPSMWNDSVSEYGKQLKAMKAEVDQLAEQKGWATPSTTTTDGGDDAGGVKASAYATDDWGRADYFYLYEVKSVIKEAQLYRMGGGTNADMRAIIMQEVGFATIAAKVIGEHPSWSARDVYLEVKDRLPGARVDEAHITYLHEHEITAEDLTRRHRKLDRALDRCRKDLGDMAPTKRPEDPRGYCKEQIVTRAYPVT